MTESFETLRIEQPQPHTVLVTLNRPDAANAMNTRMGLDLLAAFDGFNAAPGLPVLHSKDLVNWSIIGHVFRRQLPYDVFNKPQHGGGVWAPSIRYHEGEFYIFYPDPDRGIYMVKARDAAGPWSEPLLIKEARGWEDPCPLWDADGNAYLVSAMVASRSGVKSILVVSRMSAVGTRLLDDGVLGVDGYVRKPTVEGPKFYKRGGYYYIFAPAGGVVSAVGCGEGTRRRHSLARGLAARASLPCCRAYVNGGAKSAVLAAGRLSDLSPRRAARRSTVAADRP